MDASQLPGDEEVVRSSLILSSNCEGFSCRFPATGPRWHRMRMRAEAFSSGVFERAQGVLSSVWDNCASARATREDRMSTTIKAAGLIESVAAAPESISQVASRCTRRLGT